MEKHFINTHQPNNTLKNQDNNNFRIRIDTGSFDVFQLEQISFQNFYSNISFGGDFSYETSTGIQSFTLSSQYWEIESFQQALANAGFTIVYNQEQIKFQQISRTENWRPIGLAWSHCGFSQQKIQQKNYQLQTIHTPDGPVNLQYGSFYIAIDGLINDQGYTFQLPIFGGYGDLIYMQKQEGQFTMKTSMKRLVDLRFQIFDRFGQLARTQFSDDYPILWQMQIQTIQM